MGFGGLIRANTQVIVTIGPFVDVGDGFTPETGVTLSGADEAEILKHGSTSVVDISGATWAAVTSCDGYYSLTLTTSHTDTEGLLKVIVQDDSVCLPVECSFQVLSEAAYDSLFAAKDDGFMDVNIKTVGRADTQETEADNLESACSNYSATRGLAGTALPAAAADAAGGLPISDAGGLDLDGIDTKIDTIDGIVDSILVDTGTTLDGKLDTIDGIVDDILVDTGTTIPGQITGLNDLSAAEVNAEVDAAIETYHLDHLLAATYDPASKPGAADALLNEIVESDGGVSRFTTNALENARGTDNAFLAASAPSNFGDLAITASTGKVTVGTNDDKTGYDLNADQSTVTISTVSGAVGSVTGNVGGNVIGSVGSVTGNVGGNVSGNVTGTVGELAAQAKADVNAEVSDVLKTDTISELSSVPAATPTFEDAIMFLYMAARNFASSTSSALIVTNDAGSTVATSPLSDNGTTFSKGEFA